MGTPNPEDIQGVKLDETRQRGTEHNLKAFNKSLHEDGFEKVITRALSEFTIMVHTRTLKPDEEQEFIDYAEQEGFERLEGDNTGEVFRIHV